MMQQEYSIVIIDTSCLILLSKIDELDLLKEVFKEIYTTNDVLLEFGNPLPSWILVKSPTNKNYQNLLELEIDKGEASAISLNLEIAKSIIILDDLKARKIAKRLNHAYSGTFGVIIKAKKLGIIKSVKPILEKIRSTNFRFSESIFDIVLHEANEY